MSETLRSDDERQVLEDLAKQGITDLDSLVRQIASQRQTLGKDAAELICTSHYCIVVEPSQQ
jgi:hypothetical protein